MDLLLQIHCFVVTWWKWNLCITFVRIHQYNLWPQLRSLHINLSLLCLFNKEDHLCVTHKRLIAFINKLQLQKEAKAKEAKLAAESDAKEKDDGVDLPLVPPEMQVDGLAEKDELEAQLNQQIMATAKLNEQAEENSGKT